MFTSILTLGFMAATGLATSTTTIYMRIEGPTHTIYEQTIQAATIEKLSNHGHTAECDGTAKAKGVTSLTALSQTGQYFYTNWNGSTFGDILHINGTSNNADQQWGSLLNNVATTGGFILQGSDDGTDTEYKDFCSTVLPNKQHMLYAFFGDFDSTNFMILSGPSTASVGQTVHYTVPYATDHAWVNDLSTDSSTSGQRVYAQFGKNNGATASVSITFKKAGTYNMKTHCPSGTECVRSNHVVTVVS